MIATTRDKIRPLTVNNSKHVYNIQNKMNYLFIALLHVPSQIILKHILLAAVNPAVSTI